MEHSITASLTPALLMIILPSNSVGEFSFQHKGEYEILIYGVFIENEWVISLRVHALPYMAYGCNNYHTGLKDSRQVIRYFLMDFINKISPYSSENIKPIVNVIKEL